jgi:hypothetical protein
MKQIVIVPIYWGDWWVPARGSPYNWAEVNGLLQTVVGGRYMDCLNQYGIGRGVVSKTYVYPLDPPSSGFSDPMRDWMFKTAINGGHVPAPTDYDLNTQEPFYCLIVKPGVEHLLDPSLAPDVATGAYHYPFLEQYWDGGTWPGGQVCWVKGDSSISGTIQRIVHEMAEAYSTAGEISDQCQSQGPVVVDGITVPQYWSVADNACCPPPDSTPSPQGGMSRVALSALVIDILFGIIGDGGGMAHHGKEPVPVDPWGWLTKSQLDVAFARATIVAEQQLRSDPHLQREGMRFLRQLQSLLQSEDLSGREGDRE